VIKKLKWERECMNLDLEIDVLNEGIDDIKQKIAQKKN
jgi:hypothetical protein